jgi:hypothetical protein
LEARSEGEQTWDVAVRPFLIALIESSSDGIVVKELQVYARGRAMLPNT